MLDSHTPVFVSQRYDRVIPDDAKTVSGLPCPLRLHQEDICQALGFPPYRKYEIEPTDCYPLIIGRLFDRVSSDPQRDKSEFARQVIFDYLIGNCDNHVKNYSFLISPDWESRRLAPAYDLLSTTVLGYSRDMGLSVGDTRDIDRIAAKDWRLFAQDLRLPEQSFTALLQNVARSFKEHQRECARQQAHYDSDSTMEQILHDAQPRLQKLLNWE
jgi:serine/threonine-protein kinase HipA